MSANQTCPAVLAPASPSKSATMRWGDSLTLNLHPSPWPNRWLCEMGEFSSAKLGRSVALILQGGV